MIIYRIQDKDGRGPYKPGFGHVWADAGHDDRNPPFFVEFGVDIVRSRLPGENLGCGFRSLAQAKRWFTECEMQRLLVLGYKIVRMKAGRIIAESDNQIVFARKKPLRKGIEILNYTA